MRNIFWLANTIVFASFFSVQIMAQNSEPISTWAYDSIHIPKAKSLGASNEPIIVAVVDDAFNLSHNELKDFIYKNPIEIPKNQLDDDGNDYIDDVFGWDISDKDNNVGVVEGRDKEFFHGTYISSIITKVASLYYGSEASDRIKIMPIKVISDQANQTYVKDGYKGVKYAMENGADIICLAWSGGNPGIEDLKLIKQAHEKGILIIGSVGNFNEQKILNPALMPEVLSVASTDANMQKYKMSNYGEDVDISAPGENVFGAHPEKDYAYIHDEGTSASAALVAGSAAVLMTQNIGLTNIDVKEALLNTTTPFNRGLSSNSGKMGSGIINLKNALDYISENSNKRQYYSALRSKGSIAVRASDTNKSWEIKPVGSYHGFYLEPDILGIRKPDKHMFEIIVGDTVWAEYNLSNFPEKLFVPSSSLSVNVNNKAFKKNDIFKINYHAKTIDSTRLYCSDLKYISSEKGTVTDGSGDNDYANFSSCKWLITVPPGKRIKFTFDQIDTQANVDYVYLADGVSVIPENVIALFSGQNKPPIVTSKTNEVLIWFVTDKNATGQGWEFHYETVD